MYNKTKVENTIQTGSREDAMIAINEYEHLHPRDADILSMKTVFHLKYGDTDQSLKYAREGVKRLPLNGDMQYNLACVYENIGMLYDAYICYIRAGFIYQFTDDDKLLSLAPNSRANDIICQLSDLAGNENLSQTEASELLKKINALSSLSDTFGLMFEQSFRDSNSELIGKWYYEGLKSRKYVGIFKEQYFNTPNTQSCKDVVHEKAEFLDGDEGFTYIVDNKYDEYLLPIAVKEPTIHRIMTEADTLLIAQYNPFRFAYYRLAGGTRISSNTESIYGNPIPLILHPDKKRIVMSIFVDGLSYSILRDEGFKENMPNTYDFFSKGAIFNNAYNTGEWTYPSIASYVTGLYTTHHMLFHHTLDYPMPEDVPTLPEFFHLDGYYTSKYCGTWRIIPSYGHSRGYDRFVYQHQKVGFKVHEVIADTINQLEAGKDLNQYLWISIGDLHDIPDRDDPPINIQKVLSIKNRVYHNTGPTSVKQEYNPDDKAIYIQTARHIDMWLNILYEYINRNYSDDEIVISLFSDHGQGFLIEREDAHFLSDERSNIPIMFRGSSADGIGFCEETISAIDYGHILRHLSGIKESTDTYTDGQLPMIFGNSTAREYAYTESIHPGDPYYAAIYSPAKNIKFFFTNPSPVMNDGRFKLAEYSYYLEDYNGHRVDDEVLTNLYLDITLEHIAPILIYE